MKQKRVLLIAGGGTLGTYVTQELLRLGVAVDVICPEEKHSDHSDLRFYRDYVSEQLLDALFAHGRYDGIVDFIHYKQPEAYRSRYRHLIDNTDHLIFLSSYRVYADEEHPITERSPRLYDTVTDAEFLTQEDYAVPKSRCEDFLRNECANDPWTVVRPVISFSARRLDLLLYSGTAVLQAAQTGQTLCLPHTVRELGAGLDWAGNSGKLIAQLLFKPQAMGEAFTVYSGHGMTWGEVARAYSDVTGVGIRWCDEREYLETVSDRIKRWMWYYDRRFDRRIDASKILRVTGLCAEDFTSVADGIRRELDILQWKRP